MQISYVESLMKFNERVLEQGKIERYNKYTLEELKRRFFFNKIFISNMDELFEKYNAKIIFRDYLNAIKTYRQNIESLIYILYHEYEITIIDEDTFESRLNAYKYIDQLIGKRLSYNLDIYDISQYFDFENNKIYYLSIEPRGQVGIYYIDEKRSAYSDIVLIDGKYYRNDISIYDMISNDNQSAYCVAIKPTIKSGNMTKIEFYHGNGYNVGSSEIIKMLKLILPENCLLVYNDFLYLDPIERIISKHMDDSTFKLRKSQLFNDNMFMSIFEKDIIMDYPVYDFKSYLSLLTLAVEHPSVKSIYITLYRIGSDDTIFRILKYGVDNGKNIFVNIELRASGEMINYFWYNEFKKIGVNVSTFGYPNVKVHSKLTLIEFDNGKFIAQIGTGNYHTKTTSQYTDFSLLTADSSICNSINGIFKMMTNTDTDPYLNIKLSTIIDTNNDVLITRYGDGYNNLRDIFKYYIIKEANKGNDGYIAMKANSLSDPKIIESLEYAAKRGCMIDLIIRGVCTWVPSSEMLNSNVYIKSVVWDKLEHSRIYCFGRLNPTIYIGSLDLVSKKIEERLETLVKIKDPDVLLSVIKNLNRYITNNKDSWKMYDGGCYIKESDEE